MISSCVILSRPAEFWEMLSKPRGVSGGEERGLCKWEPELGNWRVNQHFLFFCSENRSDPQRQGGTRVSCQGSRTRVQACFLTSRTTCGCMGHVCGTVEFPDPNIYHPHLPSPHILYMWRTRGDPLRSSPTSSVCMRGGQGHQIISEFES